MKKWRKRLLAVFFCIALILIAIHPQQFGFYADTIETESGESAGSTEAGITDSNEDPSEEVKDSELSDELPSEEATDPSNEDPTDDSNEGEDPSESTESSGSGDILPEEPDSPSNEVGGGDFPSQEDPSIEEDPSNEIEDGELPSEDPTVVEDGLLEEDLTGSGNNVIPEPTFVFNLIGTPVMRSLSSIYRNLSGFAPEAKYEKDGYEFTGLLSECWALALNRSGGKITLVSNVTASAYDPSIYSGSTYIENGVSRNGVPHAITRFTGGLATMTVPSGVSVELDLAGYTLDRNMGSADGSADRAYTIEILSGGSFTLSDSKGTGKITGGYGSSCTDGSSYGSLIKVQSGAFLYIKGGELSGNIGKGVICGDGSVELSGDIKIQNNYITKGGSECNLLISSEMSVSASNLGDDSSVGITVARGRESDAVYYANGASYTFYSDLGLGTYLDGDYVVIGKEAECEWEAEFHSANGTVYTGTFAEMWQQMKTDHSGTLKIMKDISVTGTYEFVTWGSPVLDFNGHVIKATGSAGQNFIVIGENYASANPFRFIDSSGKARETSRRVEEVGTPSWNSDRRIYTYYLAYSEDGGTDTGIIPANEEIKADFSNLGGLDVSGYDRAVYIKNGALRIEGGAHRSDNGFGQTVWAVSRIEMTGGYVFDSGSRSATQASGGAFYMNAGESFKMSGGVIAGCEMKQGGAVRLTCNSAEITGGTITGCYGAYNGGAFYIDSTCTNVTFSNMLMCNNSGGERGGAIMDGTAQVVFTNVEFVNNNSVKGGALQVYKASGSVILQDCTFVSNTANAGGAITAENTATISITGGNIVRNTALNEGGGIALPAGSLTVKGVSIYKNEATVGSGIYVSSGDLVVGDAVKVYDNKESNVYLNSGVVAKLLESVKSGNVGFTTKDVPFEGTDVEIINDSLKYGIDFLDWITSDKGFYVKSDYPHIYLSIEKNEEIKWNGVLVQYYAYLDRLKHTGGDGSKLDLINTVGGVLPKNNITPPVLNIFVDPDGTVETNKLLTKIYQNRDVPEGPISIDDVNSFYRENYEKSEIWVAKEGTKPDSISRDDWTIMPYTEGTVLDLEKGSIVRIVCNQTMGDLDTRVVFYDYDITDGGYYTSEADVKAKENQKATSSQPSDLEDVGLYYVNTYKDGINSEGNYSNSGAKLAFGNANTGVAWSQDLWSSPEGKVYINQYNRGNAEGSVATFKGATYGIPSHLDENRNIVYSDGIDAPALFGRDSSVGKTAYVDHNLQFIRQGDTYILTSVSNTGIQNLESFAHPGKHTTIWTNNFWPMDYVRSYGTDGHDVKFGSTNRKTLNTPGYFDWTVNNKYVRMPESDDGIDHNSYFGMSFGISFNLPEGYCGPLEYYFFGDDDMWVFLDGKLICDIGGVHSAVGEYVNIWDYLEDGDIGDHRLSFFYIERGASGSTCWMRFSLPNVVPSTDLPTKFMYSFNKVNEAGEPIEGAEFTLYEDKDCTKVLDVQYSEKDGTVVFSNLAGGNVYCVMETKVSDEDYILDDSVYVLAQDDDENWFMYRLGDSNMSPVTFVVNRTEYALEMPNTGSFGLLYSWVFGSASLLVAVGIVVIVNRKFRKES